MKMISMSYVKEIQTLAKDDAKKLDMDIIKNDSFKDDLNKKIKMSEQVDKSDKSEKTEKVSIKQNDNVEKEAKNESKLNVDKDNKLFKNISPDKNSFVKKASTIKTKDNKKDESSVIQKNTNGKVDLDTTIGKKDAQNSKKVENQISLIKNSNEKNNQNSNKTKKDTDKDSLNQSIASQLNVQKPLENTNIKKNDNESKLERIDTTKDVKNIKDINPNMNGVIENPNKDLLKNKLKNISSSKSNTDNNSKIKVNDLRKDKSTKNFDSNKLSKTESGTKLSVELNNNQNLESSSERTIVLGTTEISAEGDGGKAQAPVMKEATTLLKQQLKDFGNNEIVKQTRIILKDNNIGEIKLILKPESLGQVKINLNFKQNSLAGQIVVENNIVKQAFEENMGQLSQALKDQGYDSTNLELSLSDKNESKNKEQSKNKQYFSERLKRIDESGKVVRFGAPTSGIDLTA